MHIVADLVAPGTQAGFYLADLFLLSSGLPAGQWDFLFDRLQVRHPLYVNARRYIRYDGTLPGAAVFARLDTNRDGVLERAEMLRVDMADIDVIANLLFDRFSQEENGVAVFRLWHGLEPAVKLGVMVHVLRLSQAYPDAGRTFVNIAVRADGAGVAAGLKNLAQIRPELVPGVRRLLVSVLDPDARDVLNRAVTSPE